MRCSNCGQPLTAIETVCARCGTDISYRARTHRLFVSLVYVIVCVAAMAALMYCALVFNDARV